MFVGAVHPSAVVFELASDFRVDEHALEAQVALREEFAFLSGVNVFTL